MRQTEEFFAFEDFLISFLDVRERFLLGVHEHHFDEFPSLAFTCAINSAPAPSLTHSFATSHPHIRCPSYISASALPTPMETALSVFALILPLSISALVLAHLVSLLSSLFRVAFAILLLFGLVGSTVPLFVLLWRRKSSTLLSPTTPSTLLEWSP